MGRRGLGGEVDLGDVVDHERDRGRCRGVRGQVVEGPDIDGRVAQQHVVDPLRDEPQPLAQGVAHDAREARAREDAVQHLTHAHGLAGDTDGGAGRAAHEVVGVGLQGVEVDDREGGGQVARGCVEACAERHAETS